MEIKNKTHSDIKIIKFNNLNLSLSSTFDYICNTLGLQESIDYPNGAKVEYSYQSSGISQ